MSVLGPAVAFALGLIAGMTAYTAHIEPDKKTAMGLWAATAALVAIAVISAITIAVITNQ